MRIYLFYDELETNDLDGVFADDFSSIDIRELWAVSKMWL